MTLEELLRMKNDRGRDLKGNPVQTSPEFRVSVQNEDAEFYGMKGIHVIIHAVGHDSDTLDLFINGNATWRM